MDREKCRTRLDLRRSVYIRLDELDVRRVRDGLLDRTVNS